MLLKVLQGYRLEVTAATGDSSKIALGFGGLKPFKSLDFGIEMISAYRIARLSERERCKRTHVLGIGWEISSRMRIEARSALSSEPLSEPERSSVWRRRSVG